MEEQKPKRVLFLDYMRVLALLMMIQGHTVYDFLDVSIRDGNGIGMMIWTQLRGYTAPFFMMVSGAVFAYLLIYQEKSDGSNPRVKAGTRRIITLFFWGYLLNFPVYAIFKVFTADGWDRFLNIRIGETLITIFSIAIALYLYRSLHSDDVESEQERDFMRRLFQKNKLKNIGVSTRLMNRHFLKSERKKRRFFSSFFYSLLISIPFLIISSLLSVQEKIQALRVDVLQTIGAGLLFVVLFYVIAKRNHLLMGIMHFIMMILCIGIYPLINNVDLFNLPLFVSPYLNNFDNQAMFPLIPWLAYIFAGAILGIFIANEVKKPNFEKMIGHQLAFAGLGIIGLSLLGIAFEEFAYGRTYFWTDSPNLVYHRIGIVLCVGSAMAYLARLTNGLPKFLRQMSRNTLWLYVGHLIIIYKIVKPIIGYQKRFGPVTVLIFVATMYVLMYLQTQIIVYKNKKGSYGAVLRSLVGLEKSPKAD